MPIRPFTLWSGLTQLILAWVCVVCILLFSLHVQLFSSFFSFFFWRGGANFFKVEITSSATIPLFRQESVNSGSASWDDCGWALPNMLCTILHPWQVPTQCKVSSLRLFWPRIYACFSCTLPPALLAKWLGSFTATAVTLGWDGQWIRVSTEKVNFGEENSPAAPAPCCSWIETTTFWSQVWGSPNWAIPTPQNVLLNLPLWSEPDWNQKSDVITPNVSSLCHTARRQMTCSGMWATLSPAPEKSWAQLASTLGCASVNAISCTQPSSTRKFSLV